MIDSAPTSGFTRRPDPYTDERSDRSIGVWLVLLIPVLLVLLLYGVATSRTPLGFGCGPVPPPSTYMDVMGLQGGGGEWHGAQYESFGAAAALAGVLWLAAGLALWRARRRHAAVTLALAVGFLVVYVVSLGALAAIAPQIWGPAHCVL